RSSPRARRCSGPSAIPCTCRGAWRGWRRWRAARSALPSARTSWRGG
ncbi:MAG: hypothetical protein AVDCRST_MAG13-4012, partial [uncultured Solirubrobacteraceae bacterium]